MAGRRVVHDLGNGQRMHTGSVLRIEAAEIIINRGLASDSRPDDRRRSCAEILAKRKPGLLRCLPRRNHAKLRHAVESPDLMGGEMVGGGESFHLSHRYG